MKQPGKKQFVRIGGKPILFYSLQVFQQCSRIDEIVLVVAEEDIDFCTREFLERFRLEKIKKVVAGGAERQDSVYNGLKAIAPPPNLVVIHDGARPFLSGELLEQAIQEAAHKPALVFAVPVTATIKTANQDVVETTLSRSGLWEIQTPQIFAYDWIFPAYEEAIREGFQATDDAMMVERMGRTVHIFPGDPRNIKITTKEDLDFARFLLERGR